MRKNGFIASLASLILVYGLINLILFLFIPEGRTDLASFWIAWSFTFPLNLLTTMGITIYCSRIENATIIKIPLLFTIQYIFAGIYLVTGIIFMLINKDIALAVWIVEAIITCAFIILMIYAWLGTSFLAKNVEHTKKKVFYIRSLQADIDACISQVADSDVEKLLKELSDKIRFSDPMSHDSLAQIEGELKNNVREIITSVSRGNLELIPDLVKRAMITLDMRNNRCKVLK